MKNLRSTLAALALGFASLASLAAAPSPEAVQEAIRAQNWTQAQTMLTEVTRDKPNSAKAWYYLAQTEEKLGHVSAAKADLARAETLQPDLKFASPGSVQSMELRLNQQLTVTKSYPTTAAPTHVISPDSHSDGSMALFWVLGIILACSLAIWGIYRIFFRPPVYLSGAQGSAGYGGPGSIGNSGPVYGPAGSTVVVNGGNNSSGLVEGMILGSMLSGHHHDSYRDQGYSSPAPAASSWDNTPSPSASPSSFDLGGGSSSSWGSSSSSSSFDSGSSSSDSGSSSGGGDW